MSRKPETIFIAGIHRFHIAGESPYHEKMNNPYSSGTADVWYSGDVSDLWVEYKYLAKIPKRAKITPDLSALQKGWLYRRHKEGRSIAVIIGTPEGGVIFTDLSWMEAIDPDTFRSLLLSRKEIAAWLTQQVGVSPCISLDWLSKELK